MKYEDFFKEYENDLKKIKRFFKIIKMFFKFLNRFWYVIAFGIASAIGGSIIDLIKQWISKK